MTLTRTVFIILPLHPPHCPCQGVPNEEVQAEGAEVFIERDDGEERAVTALLGDPDGVQEAEKEKNQSGVTEETVFFGIGGDQNQEEGVGEGVKGDVAIVGVEKDGVVFQDGKAKKVKEKLSEKK